MIFCNKNAKHQLHWATCFAEGLQKHGIEPYWSAPQSVVDCDIAVLWGVHNQVVINNQQRTGRDYLVMERGYFRDRFHYTSLGWNGLNGLADFKNANSPPDRWEKHGVPLMPWKTGGDYILLLGQVIGDAAVKMGGTLPDWYRRVVAEIKALTDLPVHFRPHPLAQHPLRIAGTQLAKRGPLAEALNGAACAVAYSSNALVDAVIAGVPAIGFSRVSMALPVCGQSVKDVLDPPCPDRQQWAQNLAYAQWTPEEMKSGAAWEHIKP